MTCISFPVFSKFARGCLFALVFVVTGCAETVQPVDGTVQWCDGAPAKELEGSIVSFDLAAKKVNATGVVQPDATFKLTTNQQDDGAFAGDYNVVIVERRRQGSSPDGGNMAPGLMDVKYSTAGTTDLKATVSRGRNSLTLKVDRAAKSSK